VDLAGKGIIVNQNFLSYQDLYNRSDYSLFKEYFRLSLEFCHAWLNGQQFLEISTSGSTGNLKLIQLSREQILASVQSTAIALSLDESDHSFICINTSYIGGKMMLIRAMELQMNATLVAPASNPFETLQEDSSFTFFSFVPLQIETILNLGIQDNINKGKALIIGGGAVSYSLENRLQNLNIPVFHTFGMTETASHVALRRINGPLKSKAFKLLPGIELKTDDNNCIHLKGPQTLDQWIQTRDIIKITSDQEFIWLGRIDDVINTGGIKIHTPELEEKIRGILHTYSKPIPFFVTGVTDERLIQKIVLVIEGKSNPEFKELLLNKMKEDLPKFHNPKDIFFIDKMPVTDTGKILKKEALKKISDLSA